MSSNLNRRVERLEEAMPDANDPFEKLMARIRRMNHEERDQAREQIREYRRRKLASETTSQDSAHD